MESIVTRPFKAAESLSRPTRTRRTNSRHSRRDRKPAGVHVDENTKALRGMLSLQTVRY